jgi:hypothetical protein
MRGNWTKIKQGKKGAEPAKERISINGSERLKMHEWATGPDV